MDSDSKNSTICICANVTVWILPFTSLSIMFSSIQKAAPVIDPSPIMLDFIFHKMPQHNSSPTVFLRDGTDVTSHELSLRASKFTCFTQFYANIRALKSSISTSSERETRREGERERELARIWPWLLIHNSHCLLHTFQNSFRLWR